MRRRGTPSESSSVACPILYPLFAGNRLPFADQAIGAWFLLISTRVLPRNAWRLFWPMVLMSGGAMLVLHTIRRGAEPLDSRETVGMVGVLGGSNRQSNANPFRGGGLVGTMGVESQDGYVSIRTGGKSYLKEQTLGDLESLLDPSAFVRIHRRYILNVARLSKIALGAKDSHIAILAAGTELPISRSGYGRLRELLSRQTGHRLSCAVLGLRVTVRTECAGRGSPDRSGARREHAVAPCQCAPG